MNALMSGRPGQGGSSGSMGQLLSGLTHSGGSGGSSGGIGGKIVGQLASNLFHPGGRPQQPQNYYGAQPPGAQNSGGLAGSVMGLFGGSHNNNQVCQESHI
jgi:hypothetical protein